MLGANDRNWLEADLRPLLVDFRFSPNSGHPVGDVRFSANYFRSSSRIGISGARTRLPGLIRSGLSPTGGIDAEPGFSQRVQTATHRTSSNDLNLSDQFNLTVPTARRGGIECTERRDAGRKRRPGSVEIENIRPCIADEAIAVGHPDPRQRFGVHFLILGHNRRLAQNKCDNRVNLVVAE